FFIIHTSTYIYTLSLHDALPILALPVQILYSISKGAAFTKRNIARFKAMSIYLAVVTLGGIFIPYIFHLFFRNIIPPDFELEPIDRKSTRLNSSHSQISYAVFCL